jgi:hypothetical protein
LLSPWVGGLSPDCKKTSQGFAPTFRDAIVILTS